LGGKWWRPFWWCWSCQGVGVGGCEERGQGVHIANKDGAWRDFDVSEAGISGGDTRLDWLDRWEVMKGWSLSRCSWSYCWRKRYNTRPILPLRGFEGLIHISKFLRLLSTVLVHNNPAISMKRLQKPCLYPNQWRVSTFVIYIEVSKTIIERLQKPCLHFEYRSQVIRVQT
jgi:hypothetical protein